MITKLALYLSETISILATSFPPENFRRVAFRRVFRLVFATSCFRRVVFDELFSTSCFRRVFLDFRKFNSFERRVVKVREPPIFDCCWMHITTDAT